MLDMSSVKPGAPDAWLGSSDDWHRHNVRAAGPQGPGDLANRLIRGEEMLVHILGDHQVEHPLFEGLGLQVLVAVTLGCVNGAGRKGRIVLGLHVTGALVLQPEAGAATNWRALVNPQLPPVWIEARDYAEQGALPRHGAAACAF